MAAIVDDILVYGKSREEHDSNLRAALERALQKKSYRLNEDEVCTVRYGTLATFCSMGSYALIPPKSQPSRKYPREKVTSLLRELFSNSVEFYWGKPQYAASQRLKK